LYQNIILYLFHVGCLRGCLCVSCCQYTVPQCACAGPTEANVRSVRWQLSRWYRWTVRVFVLENSQTAVNILMSVGLLYVLSINETVTACRRVKMTLVLMTRARVSGKAKREHV